MEFACYCGNKSRKVSVRVFAIRLPEEIANERRRKLRKHAIKRGRNLPRKETLELCGWNFFITNIAADKGLSIQELLALYPIRWSIELFFKQLKSVLCIHKTEVKSNAHRIQCEILGKIILTLFICFCYSTARSKTWQLLGKELSFEKTMKYFKRNGAYLFILLVRSWPMISRHIQRMIVTIIDSCQKHRQPSRKNSLDVFIDRSLYSNLALVTISQQEMIDFGGALT